MISLGVSAVLIWITLQSLAWYTKHNEYIIVPDYRGLYIHDVLENPENKYYQFSVIDSIYDGDKPKGSILSQDPFPGAKVKKNRMVYISITSQIPEKTTMPDLHDLTLRQAQTVLESTGLKLGKLLYIRSFDEDAVQNQFFEGKPIKPGSIIDKGSSITLTVGMGAKASETSLDSVRIDSLK